MKSFELSIEGMSCGGCVNAVQTALDSLTGVEVEAVQVGSARGEFDDGKWQVEELIAAVEARGFQAQSKLRV